MKIHDKVLTPEQISEIQAEMIPGGVPVRFLVNGWNIESLRTGELSAPSTNVIHQMVYWNFTRATALKIAGWLGAKAVFDKE